ncbi:succinylglutamate desuccinylase/aspartoacylase family protein [uncultured Clostridium sp.]|uniref:succinylglutamate desuccinylase/aspartoacylase family protein n=1 Tax=uncultured Clostridium sp. TaxID=59620 RepID=UPI0025DEF18D|nr:succinylglutamate desuccinylase/aspartoacylase family protein [uncultured Clostridium sp.]
MSGQKKKGRCRPVLLLLFVLCAVCLFMVLRPGPKTELIMEHTPLETGFTILESGSPGKTVLVVGGIHGDETSGWMAADQLKKRRKLKSGTLIILSPANAPGSRNGERNVEQYRDLNRSFPGDKNRDLTDGLAASIFLKIREYSPDLVIDLHEAYREGSGRDFLGNSLIITDSGTIDQLVFDLIVESQDGTIKTSAPFSCYNGTPAGSLNRTVTETLGIPAVTVEVSQEEPLETRIRNQIAVVERILGYYSME